VYIFLYIYHFKPQNQLSDSYSFLLTDAYGEF